MTLPDSAVNLGTSTNRIQKLLYQRREGAEMLSVSLRTLDTLIATNQLKAIRIGRSVRIPLDALQEFLKRDHRTDGGMVQ
jgi:excisionase family DNA binding protein